MSDENLPDSREKLQMQASGRPVTRFSTFHVEQRRGFLSAASDVYAGSGVLVRLSAAHECGPERPGAFVGAVVRIEDQVAVGVFVHDAAVREFVATAH